MKHEAINNKTFNVQVILLPLLPMNKNRVEEIIAGKK